MKDSEEDDLGRCVDKIRTQIKKRVQGIVHDKSSYNTHIDKHIANEDVFSTLQALLSARVTCGHPPRYNWAKNWGSAAGLLALFSPTRNTK